ncbi:MAG TPA: PP2C family protein-serine/threonine phosphatase [Chloroflexota bacterium]|nr:PP2C family protein-serine/threonine phosphatase [Chloroflexota bacterium]
MGKGMPAALLMATARAALRAVSDEALAERAVSRAAAALADDLDRSGSFVTIFRAHVTLGTRCLSYVDAGHGHVFLRRAGGAVEALAPRALPLGAFPDAPSEGGTLVLGAGDLLVVYSDGLPDSLGDHAPSSEQLSALAVSAPTAAAVVERLIALAPTQTTLPDDLTVIALRCTG